jgi:hypothetical protein
LIGAIAAILAQRREILAIDDREGETELRLQLVLPLADHAGRRRHEHEVDAPAKEQFAKHQARLNGLARSYVVGDQEVHPGQA